MSIRTRSCSNGNILPPRHFALPHDWRSVPAYVLYYELIKIKKKETSKPLESPTERPFERGARIILSCGQKACRQQRYINVLRARRRQSSNSCDRRAGRQQELDYHVWYTSQKESYISPIGAVRMAAPLPTHTLRIPFVDKVQWFGFSFTSSRL